MTWAVRTIDTQTGLATSAQSPSVETEVETEVAIGINVTVAGGTPTLDITVEWSHDGGTTWGQDETPDAFAQITGTGMVIRHFPVKAPRMRLSYVVGGTTPSFDFVATSYGVR